MKKFACVFMLATLAACSGREADVPHADSEPEPATAPVAPAPAPDAGRVDGTPAPAMPADNAPVEATYLGRWVGVEGKYLEVAATPAGGVTLEMQWDLDNKASFDGSVTAEGLRFMRNGEAQTAVHTDGDATGLKYLAGKRDCLTVKPGEGYCRD